MNALLWALGIIGGWILVAIPVGLAAGAVMSTRWHPDKGRGVGDKHGA